MQQLTKSKKTELGNVPEDWDVIKLQKVCKKITDGVHKTPKYVQSGVPFISVNNLRKDGIDFNNCKYISVEEHKELVRRCNPVKGDILLGKVGTLGNANIVSVDFEFSIFVQLALLKPELSLVNPVYLKYVLNSQELQRQINNNASGSTLRYIGINKLENLNIFYPPLWEQQKIACILSKADELIQKTAQIIEQTQTLKKGLMQRLLTRGIGHTKFKNIQFYGKDILIPEAWKIVDLGTHTTKIGSGVTPRGGSKVYLDKGIPLIRSQNVHFDGLKLDDVAYINEKIDEEMKNSRTQIDDVLLNITGASVGRCTFVPPTLKRGNVNQHVCIIRPNSAINSIYLSIYLSSDIGQKIIHRSYHGLSREGLTFSQIAFFKLLMPPMEEQEKIASVINSIDFLIRVNIQNKRKIEELKKGLMQQLLTGKIRVKI